MAQTKKKWIVFGLIAAQSALTFAVEVLYDFDAYQDGSVNGQEGWRLLSGQAESFTVVDGGGRTAEPGDKALKIEFRKPNSRLAAPAALTWDAGDAWSIDFDFQLNLEAGHCSSVSELLLLIMGNSGLELTDSWLEAVGIMPDGKWVGVGAAPDKQLQGRQPESTFLARPPEGRADSEWFHFHFSSVKKFSEGTFESRLLITDASGVVKQHRIYTVEEALDERSTGIWLRKRLSCGFGTGKAAPNGYVVVDNLRMKSEIRPETYTCNFDEYSEGLLPGQKNWSVLKGGAEGFRVVNQAGRSGKPNDHALKISFDTAESHMWIPAFLSWEAGETWALEFDFKLVLKSGNAPRRTAEMLNIAMGAAGLDGQPWIQMLAIQRDGRWSWLGKAPDLKLNKNLSTDLFLLRPKSGVAESRWLNFSFISKKARDRRSFKSELKITDAKHNETVFQQRYTVDPVEGAEATALMNLESLNAGFSQGKTDPGGWIIIDNIKMASIPRYRSGSSMKGSISEYVLETIKRQKAEREAAGNER